MGCGASVPGTNEQEQDANAPGMRPIRRTIDEFKRRTRIVTMSTPSSKQLLHDGEHTDIDENSQMNSPPHDCSKSVYSPVKEENCQDMYTEEKSVEKDDINERAITKKQHRGEDEDGEFAPGSPSFRMYYIASVDSSMDSEDSTTSTHKEEDVHHDENDEKTEKKNGRTESIVSSEESVTTLVKKEPKGKRFRRGLPNVGQAAVKNLLNKSCYTPCMNPHAHDNMNSVKVTAT